jgi:hypothetical protein
MKILLLLSVVSLMSFCVQTEPECAYCFTGTCYGNDDCFDDGCICLIPAGEFKGRCYSVEE